jgi:hypothetical protein
MCTGDPTVALFVGEETVTLWPNATVARITTMAAFARIEWIEFREDFEVSSE